MGEMIEFAANGGTLPGYLATPENPNGKAVVVLQEWWGLVPHIQDVADRFAAAGYLALAPDLYRGERTTDADVAGRQMMSLDIERAEKDLRGAIAAAAERAGVERVGVIGFCMGGQLALLAATASPSAVGAAVDFYGIHPKIKPDFSRLECPVLGLFAENDEYVGAEAVAGLVAAIEGAGKRIEHHIYPGVGHAFFNDARPEAHDAAAAADAWERSLAFLDASL
jgi:carboxymethylenebutenolidase